MSLHLMRLTTQTSIDNHNRCVTFGAGLLKNEDIPSYSWLLKAFLKAHIHHRNRDAQMLVDKFRNMVTCVPEFSFDFKCEKNELVCIFWADETSKCNYREFGDVIAFDATYSTNKHKMVFVPFTGVDNHNRCVTFGAGLLKNEDIPSYSWLLKAFLKAHIHHSTLVLTNQDPSLFTTVSEQFPNSHHRLCMWHIMNKLSLKVEYIYILGYTRPMDGYINVK